MNVAPTNPTTSDACFRQDKLFNVLVHGLVIWLSLSVLRFVVGWVVELSGFPSGKLAVSFQFVVDITEQPPIRSALWFLLLLWFDGWLYATYYRRFGRRSAQAWFFGVFMAIMAALAFCLWASHSFLIRMIEFQRHFL